jgi:hypothetical protein
VDTRAVTAPSRYVPGEVGLIRRRTLLFGLGGAALLAGGGVALRLGTGYTLPEGAVPIALTDKEFAIVWAIVEALLPADGDLPSGVDLGVPQRIDEELWSMNAETRSDLQSALSALEYWPVMARYGSRLSKLPPARRAEVLSEMAVRGPRPIALAASSLKQMCHLFFYAHERTWAAIGYDGPIVRTAQPPPSAVAYRALLDARRSGS